jgi:hypothetical protein
MVRVEPLRAVRLQDVPAGGVELESQSIGKFVEPSAMSPFVDETLSVLVCTAPVVAKTAVAVTPAPGVTEQFAAVAPQALASSCQPLNVQPVAGAAVSATAAADP